MSFIFSRAVAEEYSQENCSDTDAFVLSSTMNTPNQSLLPDKTTKHSRRSRFGMTFAHLTAGRGEELLTLWLEGFRAKDLAPPAQGTDLTIQKQPFGLSKIESFAKWNQSTHSWKTPQPCLFEGLKGFSGTWPRWGLMQDGACYQQVPAALRMNATGSGYWLPTPTAHNAKEGNYPAERTRNTPTLAAVLGGKINPEFTEWMMGWPIGHTDLKPLETAKRQLWLQQHGACLEASK